MLTATSDLARVHPASPIETVAVPQRSPFGLNTASRHVVLTGHLCKSSFVQEYLSESSFVKE
jgi:hypothetical protein